MFTFNEVPPSNSSCLLLPLLMHDDKVLKRLIRLDFPVAENNMNVNH